MIQNAALKKIIQAQVLKDRKVKKAFDDKIFPFFERVKKEMLRELDNHPISRDLQNDIDSGTVTKGTLFGFLGFEMGEDPVQELRTLLEKNCKIRFYKENLNKGSRTYIVNIPSKDDIYQATPLRWAPGRSWVKAIEFGISGMGNYIEIESDKSRSGEGIQSKTSNSGGRFRNTSYISTILVNFQKKLLDQGIKIS